MNLQIDTQRERWEVELAQCRARRSALSARIRDERCGFDPAESEGSRVALKAHRDNESRIEELRDLLRLTAMPTYMPQFAVREGSVVTVRFSGSEPLRMIVAPHSHDETIEPCPPDTPLGSALVGRRRGDTLSYTVDGRARSVTIIDLIV
ncbi:GreA/GreB family elongation factor [Rhodococcus sp. NPDC003348]